MTIYFIFFTDVQNHRVMAPTRGLKPVKTTFFILMDILSHIHPIIIKLLKTVC